MDGSWNFMLEYHVNWVYFTSQSCKAFLEGYLPCLLSHFYMLLSNGAFLLVYCNKIVELWTKRNFRCDCGNSKFGEFFCKLFPNKDIENADNSYNHNFKGSYCTCGRPYPDPDAEEQVEMIQCYICEDWFHEEHLGLESSGEVSSLCFHYGSQFFLFLFRCSFNFLWIISWFYKQLVMALSKKKNPPGPPPSQLCLHTHTPPNSHTAKLPHRFHQIRTFINAGIKWVRDPYLDFAVQREKDLKQAISLKSQAGGPISLPIPRRSWSVIWVWWCCAGFCCVFWIFTEIWNIYFFMGVWERKGAVYGLCNGREQEREAEKHQRRKREKMVRKEEGGPSNGNKLGSTWKLSPDLNPAWIQKQVKD